MILFGQEAQYENFKASSQKYRSSFRRSNSPERGEGGDRNRDYKYSRSVLFHQRRQFVALVFLT